jgi:hypothetical protein
MLLDLLARKNGVELVRWEGLEDIDLCHGATCSYVQAKHGSVDKRALIETLLRFEQGWKAAAGPSRFILIHPKGTSSPRRWPQYVIKQFPAALLDRVDIQVVPDTQELLNGARVRLSLIGIASSQLNHALNELLQLLSDARVELSDADVRRALSRFPRELPPEELQVVLATNAIRRLRDRLGVTHEAGPHIDRPAPIAAIAQFRASEKRLLILKGLPGAGKTTLLLTIAEREPNSILTSFADMSSTERWSAQLDRDLQAASGRAAPPFLTLCSGFVDRETLILVDQVEHSSDPVAALEQVLSDLSLLPAKTKVIAAIRWASLPTQAEARVVRRSDVVVAEVPELDDHDLSSFMQAFGLPQQIPAAARRVLRTPFAVRLFAASHCGAKPWANLGSAMREFFGQVTASTRARDLFLDAVGAAALDLNYAETIPIRDILAAGARQAVPLTLRDCDSAAADSSLRCFIDRGVLTEARDGIRATHDLWMEYLAARALHSAASGAGAEALIEVLLEADWGIRWSCIPMLAEILSKDELLHLVNALVSCITDYLGSLTDEERADLDERDLTLQHVAMQGRPTPNTAHLRHLLELRRAENMQRFSLARASRAIEVLASLFSVNPTVVGECVEGARDETRSWLVRSMLPGVVLDPYVVALVDTSRHGAVRFVLRLAYVMAVSSVSVRLVGKIRGEGKLDDDGGDITIRAFEGPRLPSVFKRLHMNGMNLIIPSAFGYFPAVLPSLLGLVSDLEDEEIIGYLQLLADYSAVAIAARPDSKECWRELVSSVPADCLGTAGWILGSTYPHVDPKVLVFASLERLQREPASYTGVRGFITAVVGSAIEFSLVDLADLSTQKRLDRFARAADLWNLDVTIDGMMLMKGHLDELAAGAERVAVLCLLFLFFDLRLQRAADGPEILRNVVEAQRTSVRDLLRTILTSDYAGFDVESEDPSRIPLSLSTWLREAGKAEDAAEFLRVGESFAAMCDSWFGAPRAEAG